MSKLIERLDRLHKAEHEEGEQGGDAFCNWANASAMAYPKLRAVAEAAKELANLSPIAYEPFERALAALEEEV